MYAGIVTFDGFTTLNVGGGVGSGINQVVDSIIPSNCAGVATGPRKYVLNAAVLNKVRVEVCGDKNLPGLVILQPNENFTAVAGTYRSVSISVVSGTGTIAINGGSAVNIATGYNIGWTADTVLGYSITVNTNIGVIIITTIQ
jgi:hypothetical protein